MFYWNLNKEIVKNPIKIFECFILIWTGDTFGSDMGRGGGVKKFEFWSKIQKYKGTFGTTNYPYKNYISILNLW